LGVWKKQTSGYIGHKFKFPCREFNSMKAIVAFLAVLLLFSGVAALPTDSVNDDYVVDIPAEKKDNAAVADTPQQEEKGSSNWYITKSNYVLPYEEADGYCFYYFETTYVRNTDYQIAFHTYEVTDLRCWSDN